MGKIDANYDDFSLKLRQYSSIDKLKKYILWQREMRSKNNTDNFENSQTFLGGPVSINLDITVACNYCCAHCVDSKILNTNDKFSLEEIYRITKVLSSNGLKSIILIGGGEPALHPQFESIVRSIKSLGVQLGIVTNGSRISRLIKISDCLNERDWIRFSLDAGSDETFQKIHKPNTKVSLMDICSGVKHIKEGNDKVSIGFSYIIFYEGCNVNGIKLSDNVDEIPSSVRLAVDFGFDYITFKPCLIKSGSTCNRETLLYGENRSRIEGIANRIKERLYEAKGNCNGRIRMHESINLRAMLGDDLDRYKLQPRNCHSQIYRQIVTPIGIYHCPAYRGDAKALIGARDGYFSQEKYEETCVNNLEVMRKFDASKECKDIVCFYNRLNWWIEDVINSGEDVDSIDPLGDDNSFL